jgi:hypothetical protein
LNQCPEPFQRVLAILLLTSELLGFDGNYTLAGDTAVPQLQQFFFNEGR